MCSLARNLLPSPVQLRAAHDGDWPLLRRWSRLPDVQRWWGSASTIEAEMTIALSTPAALARIVLHEGAPIGYAQAVDAGVWADAMPPGLAAGTYDLDLFIADPHHRGRGIGPAALTLLIQEVFETTLATAVCLVVSVANERAVRAYEKAGFSWRRVIQDPQLGPCWLLVRDRVTT
jgi:aminoglycoside 6'-N-acetyltransferase